MYKYLTYEPENFSKDEEIPLLIFLHGSPQRSNNFDKLRNVPIPKYLEDKTLTLPMLVIAPLCPTDSSWDTQHLFDTYNDVLKKYNIDQKRIYLTGFSMGGFGALKFAKEYPDIFAAVAPVCSGGTTLFSEYLKDIPFWFFHGKKDQIIDYQKTKELVEDMKNYNPFVKFTTYEYHGHKIWDETYANEKLYSWFLSNVKK